MIKPYQEQRELRKQLLQLEIEYYRQDVANNLQQLRKPLTFFHQAHVLFWLLGGGKTKTLSAILAIIAGKRLGWLAKTIPLVLASWRIAKLLQGRRK